MRTLLLLAVLAILACYLPSLVQAQLYWSDGAQQHEIKTAMIHYTGYWQNVRF